MVLGPSNIAGKIETSFMIVVSACVVLLVAVTVTMLVFLYRYNRKRHPVPGETRENIPLEIIWTVIPTILVILMFYFGWVDFDYIRNPPKDAMNVDVISRQWSWTFRYENGKQSDTLRVPVGQPVKLTLTSEDVLHCLFIPAYRVKEDCVPGLKTHLWFTANEAGTYNIFCTEYCGLEHSHMISKLITMSAAEFSAWYQSKPEAKAGQKGLDLLQSKGCLGCHTTDGTPKVGPTFKGLYERKVTVSTQGKERTIVADEEYLKRAVLDPGSDVVKGFPNIMPKMPVSEDELKEIVNYIETLK
ncbi:MAG TPA: cytochrome c oxidase subunit II [Candidatus Sulfobium mesophilum]|nr:cytochrome c oxidase subunit II [Candidatus Sulfobium mesophilum]